MPSRPIPLPGTSRLVTQYIDPDELPFTTEEVYLAACRFLPEATARMMADHLTECGPGLIAARVERRAGWHRAGIPGAATAPIHGWVYPEELLENLSAMSAELAQRVVRLRLYLGVEIRERGDY